jgi:hypothetical protein
MLKTLTLFSNGIVMAFDEHGEQLPQYQGTHAAVRARLRDVPLEGVAFEIGSWNHGTLPMNRAQFFSTAWDETVPLLAPTAAQQKLDPAIDNAPPELKAFWTERSQAVFEKWCDGDGGADDQDLRQLAFNAYVQGLADAVAVDETIARALRAVSQK